MRLSFPEHFCYFICVITYSRIKESLQSSKYDFICSHLLFFSGEYKVAEGRAYIKAQTHCIKGHRTNKEIMANSGEKKKTLQHRKRDLIRNLSCINSYLSHLVCRNVNHRCHLSQPVIIVCHQNLSKTSTWYTSSVLWGTNGMVLVYGITVRFKWVKILLYMKCKVECNICISLLRNIFELKHFAISLCLERKVI